MSRISRLLQIQGIIQLFHNVSHHDLSILQRNLELKDYVLERDTVVFEILMGCLEHVWFIHVIPNMVLYIWMTYIHFEKL